VVAAVNGWGMWPGVGKDNNRADAAALCAIGAQLISHPIVEIGASQERAMEGLRIARCDDETEGTSPPAK